MRGEWDGAGPRAFSDAVGAEVEPDQDCPNGEKSDGAAGFCPGPRGQETVMGWGVLGERVFPGDGRAIRERASDRHVHP